MQHHFTSANQPQANSQIKAVKVILQGLKKRLNEAKYTWANEIGSILWSYRMTPQLTMGKTPFKLTFEVNAMIPVEVKEPSPRDIFQALNFEALQEEVDFSSKARKMAHIWEKVLKQRITRRYNSAIVPRKFEKGDLVL